MGVSGESGGVSVDALDGTWMRGRIRMACFDHVTRRAYLLYGPRVIRGQRRASLRISENGPFENFGHCF